MTAAAALAALSAPCAAETNWHLAVEPLFGLKIGQLDEYVFLKEANFSDDTYSELNWELKPELYAGAKVRGGWKALFGELCLTAGIPMQTGSMRDYDWLNNAPASMSGGVDAAAGCGNWLTCYSEHDNCLEQDVTFGVKAGYEFAPRGIFLVAPALAFDYNSIQFSGRNGKGWYGYGADGKFYGKNHYYAACDDAQNQLVSAFSGEVITYRRESCYVWLGADAALQLPRGFSVSAGFFFAPYVYAVSYDSHVVTGNDYADITDGFFAALKGSMGAAWRIDRHSAVLLGAEYCYQRPLRGDDYTKKASATTYALAADVDGGAGARWLTVTLSYRLTFF